jgi:hypothetical protein
LVPVGRGGVSGKVLAVGVAPRAGGAEGVLQLACLRNARSLLRLSDLKRRGLCFGPPRCRLTSSVTRDNLAIERISEPGEDTMDNTMPPRDPDDEA